MKYILINNGGALQKDIKKYLLLFSLITLPFHFVMGREFISKEEAHRLVNKEKALLLDVRTSVEFAIKHIDGAKRVSVSELQKEIKTIEKWAGGKDKPIVIYCMSGGRASSAEDQLIKAGFKKVYNLGGIMRWY